MRKLFFTKIHTFPTYLKVIAAFALITLLGLTTLFVLSSANDSAKKKESSQAQVERDNAPAKITTLKTSATEKLAAGDKDGGIKDLKSGLDLAKEMKDEASISYFTQQIDYAENTPFSDRTEPTYTDTPVPPESPGYISR